MHFTYIESILFAHYYESDIFSHECHKYHTFKNTLLRHIPRPSKQNVTFKKSIGLFLITNFWPFPLRLFTPFTSPMQLKYQLTLINSNHVVIECHRDWAVRHQLICDSGNNFLMKTFPEKVNSRTRVRERASKSVHLLVIRSRGDGEVGGMNGAGQEEDACAPWPRGRFRHCGHLCAHPASFSFALSLFSSLFHPPVESTAASHIYKGSLGIVTLRIITAVTCQPLNPRAARLSSPETNAQEFEPGEFDLFSMHFARLFVSLLRVLFVSLSFLINVRLIIYKSAL